MSPVATASCRMVPTHGVPCSPTPHRRRPPPAPRRRYAQEVTRPKPRSPQRQHRRVEPPIGQRQTSRRFPSYVTTQPLDRFPIRQALQRLEDHHRPNHRARYRRSAPRAEQIPKHLSGTPAVLSQKLIHRTLRNQLPTQFHSVQKLTITTFTTLHTTYNNPNKPKTRTSQHPTDRLNQQSPRRSGKEGGGSTSTSEVETTSNLSCSRWRVSTCLMLPKGSVSVVNLAGGVVSTEKSSSLWRGDSRGRRHRDMVHRRTGALYPNRDTCSMR